MDDHRLTEFPVERVRPNPDQPRKHFDKAKLQELAASIHEHGLMQPISVRPVSEHYVIVAGERRYRAHLLNGAKTIRCLVEPTSERDADEQAIVENLQRVDISPLEEAHAYQRMMDRYGYDEKQLAKRLGIQQPWRMIRDRVSLLRLRREYQQLLESEQITPSQAYEMSRLQPRHQDVLFRSIRSGQIRGYDALRAAATALDEQERQGSLLPVDDRAPTESERADKQRFESRIERVTALLRASIVDDEVVAVRKVDPRAAAISADLLAAMQKDLRRIELALRQAAIQQDALTVAYAPASGIERLAMGPALPTRTA